MKFNVLETNTNRYPDLEAHEPGCMSEDDSGLDPMAGYLDLFCSCHRYTEPKILSNGTDIAWPAGWTDKEAAQWRAANGLVQPEASLP